MRVFPSDVVALIDELFPWAAGAAGAGIPPNGSLQINQTTRPQLASISGALKYLPEELIILQGRVLIEFNTAADDLDSTLGEISQNDTLVKYRNYGRSPALG